MGSIPVIEKADEIVVDNSVLGRQEVEVDKLGGRPDEPFREPQLGAQLFCVLNLGKVFVMSGICPLQLFGITAINMP